MSITKARQLAEFIANADVDSDEIATGAVSASKLAATLDLSSKTIVLPDVAAFNITSGDVGIGTANPAGKFHIASSSGNTILNLQRTNTNTTGTVGALTFTASDGHVVAAVNALGDGNDDGANLQFRTTSAASGTNYYNDTDPRMTILGSNGNVGIGTASPGYKLQVDHGTGSQYASSIRNTADNLQLLLGTTSGGLLNIQGKTISSNAVYQIALNAEGGNVGIGTASPSRLLEVRGSSNPAIRLNNTTDIADIGITSSAGALVTGSTSGALAIVRGGANDINFGTNGQNRVTINSSGNVGIGTTSPSTNLHIVSGTAQEPHILLQNNNSSGADVGITFADSVENYAYRIGTDDTGNKFVFTHKSGGIDPEHGTDTAILSLQPNGNVGIGTASPATSYGKVLQIHDTGTAGANLRLTDANSGAGTGNGLDIIQLGVDSYFINREAGDVNFYTNGQERFTIHADGHLGFGDSVLNDSPWSNVFGARSQWDTMGTIAATNGSMQIGHNWYYDGSNYRHIASGKANRMIHVNDYISWEMTDTTGSAGGAITFFEAMVLKSNGNLGIGTNNPQRPLHVKGEIYVNHNADNAGVKTSFRALHTSNNTIEIHQFGQSHSNGAVNQIGVSNAEQHLHLVTDSSANVDAGTSTKGIFLRSGGNVGIGTTSPTEKLHVAGVIRSEGYDTDSITSYNITGNYTAGTEYVFTTRADMNALGYGAGFYKFLVWSDTFNTGTSHYQVYTPYDEFYHNNYSSNTSTVQTINYGVSMGHAPNTATRAIDIRLRHKYGADATYPANQTFTFIPVNGFSGLTGATGRHLRIYLFKVA